MEVDVIDWKLIGACNLRCGHCYGPPKSEQALPLEDLLTVTERFEQVGTQWVVVTGGEPLLVPGIERVLERMSTRGIKVALSTNSSFFRRYQDMIERHVSSLNIPLDGSTPEIHALSRHDERTFHSFFDVLDHYRDHPEKKPPLIRVGTVYSTATQDDLLAMAQLLEPYADVFDMWKIYELIDYEFQPERRQSLLHPNGRFSGDMNRLLGGTPIADKIMVSPAYRRDKAYFMINPQGELILPTDINGVTHEIVLGNFLTDPLEELVEEWRQRVVPTDYFENHTHYRRQEPESIENEIKLRIENPALVRNALKHLGADYSTTETQSDTYFARENGVEGENIRVRAVSSSEGEHYGYLTYKSPLDTEAKFLKRDEHQTRVDDPSATLTILESLGYKVVDRITKIRELYHLGRLEIALDYVEGLGHFIEVEGDDTSIMSVVSILGLQAANHINKSYSALRDEKQ